MRTRVATMLTAAMVLVMMAAGATAVNAQGGNGVTLEAAVVGPEGFLYTPDMERVTPLWVVLVQPGSPMVKVYCVGWSVSWKCRNLQQMVIVTLVGHIGNLQLTADGQTFHTVQGAVVVESVIK